MQMALKDQAEAKRKEEEALKLADEDAAFIEAQQNPQGTPTTPVAPGVETPAEESVAEGVEEGIAAVNQSGTPTPVQVEGVTPAAVQTQAEADQTAESEGEPAPVEVVSVETDVAKDEAAAQAAATKAAPPKPRTGGVISGLFGGGMPNFADLGSRLFGKGKPQPQPDGGGGMIGRVGEAVGAGVGQRPEGMPEGMGNMVTMPYRPQGATVAPGTTETGGGKGGGLIGAVGGILGALGFGTEEEKTEKDTSAKQLEAIRTSVDSLLSPIQQLLDAIKSPEGDGGAPPNGKEDMKGSIAVTHGPMNITVSPEGKFEITSEKFEADLKGLQAQIDKLIQPKDKPPTKL